MPMKFGTIPGVKHPVSRIVQGSTMIGNEDGKAALDQIFALGCNALDTARVYGSEGDVGSWINSRGIRDDLVLIGKGAHFAFAEDGSTIHRVTPECIAEDIATSLESFGTDYMDLYLLHRDNPDVPVDEIVDSLNEHQRAGRIHAFGGSNWTADRIFAANAYAESKGLTPFVASSPNYSLAEQYDEPWPDCVTISGPANEDQRRQYQEADLPLLTWSSMAGGFLTGRYTRDDMNKEHEGVDAMLMRCYGREPNFQRLDRVAELAAEKGLTGPQIALAYTMNQPLNVFTLIANNSEADIVANIAALDTELTPAELEWLDLRRDSRV